MGFHTLLLCVLPVQRCSEFFDKEINILYHYSTFMKACFTIIEMIVQRKIKINEISVFVGMNTRILG